MRTPSAHFVILSSALWCSVPASAADIYKCTTDGKTQYQGTPCEPKATSQTIQARKDAPGTSLVGCYSTATKGMQDGFAIRGSTSASYELVLTKDKNTEVLPLKSATQQEIQQTSEAISVELTEGLSVQWPADKTKQLPVGLYRGRDPGGKEVLVAYSLVDAGFAKKTACR